MTSNISIGQLLIAEVDSEATAMGELAERIDPDVGNVCHQRFEVADQHVVEAEDLNRPLWIRQSDAPSARYEHQGLAASRRTGDDDYLAHIIRNDVSLLA